MSELTKKQDKMGLRLFMLAVGLYLMGMGITLIIKSQTGTSPMSSITNLMTKLLPIFSLGVYTFLLNVCFFFGEFIVEPKSFKWAAFLQLVPTFFMSAFVDVNGMIFANLAPSSYVLKLVVLIIGCMVFGLSIAFMISADVILQPGEALVKVISVKYGIEYGNVKVGLDVSLVVLTVIVSLICLGYINGVREGTLIAALIIGKFTSFFKKYTNKLVNA